MKPLPSAICFDAYGTLFDVYSVGQCAEDLFPGMGSALARMWRDKQVEYTRLRSMGQRYETFWSITQDSLVYCGAALGLAMGKTEVNALMTQYASLSGFPEALETLKRLKAAGLKLAIHSNGDPDMLAKAVASSGMQGIFETVLSADTVKRYKIDASVYQLAPDYFGCAANDILFVSSNGWDICGASWFGFETFWVNRAGAPREQLGVIPNHEAQELSAVADLLCSVSTK
jgi:2-haloacid dehalogenase